MLLFRRHHTMSEHDILHRVARRMRKSRQRFHRLRDQMRSVRRERRARLARRDPFEGFSEWAAWSMDEGQEPEVEDIFEDWREAGGLRKVSFEEEPFVIVAKGKPQTVAKYSPRGKVNNAIHRGMRQGPEKKKVERRPKAAKKQQRLRVKCAAKQPRQRGLAY